MIWVSHGTVGMCGLVTTRCIVFKVFLETLLLRSLILCNKTQGVVMFNFTEFHVTHLNVDLYFQSQVPVTWVMSVT